MVLVGEQETPPVAAETHAYGYALVSSQVTGDDIQRLKNELRRFARTAGHRMANVFIDHPRSPSAFAALMDALRTDPGAIVVVPTLHHLARMPALQVAMRLVIETDAGARVLVMEPDQQSPVEAQ
ncbi:DNA invertase Pin-like site-specific DNA recombinase [Spinactinospora alkalitolerans]|uniref:DNA invertase Pin-like site-specific DNA recombinase n=1 Tax=Spinactinospora alkalitolerans TaxID=687207 RepID=A0A852TVM4_9ACTN|nr:recombinase family protein [Spinactinospora alkalitolerans]NYE48069.1 DNA invertase Pin-like site-specific DNA recombinase [Spinactinospora alkalitolerans]